MSALLHIDANSPTPAHRQLYEAWQRGILTGRFSAGFRVPSSRELARSLAISRSTVVQAYEQLISEGYLEATHGSGTFVCRELPDRPLRSHRVKRSGGAPARAARLSQYAAALTDEYPQQPPRSAGSINFSTWDPDLEQFPWAVWRQLLSRRSRRLSAECCAYTEQVRGHEGLRAAIAAYVGRTRGVVCTASQILIVNGSQQGLDLCARLLFDRGDRVVVENPGYPGAIRTFSAYGAHLIGAPVDRDGIVCRDLLDHARVVYVTPSHQFPTGVSMSLNRRLELLDWARQRAAVIIEDDYDSEYRYGGSPVPALQGLAEGVSVVYCGTFSKVLFPGLRIGYLVLPEPLAATFVRAKRLADNFTPTLEQMVLRDFIEDGHLDRHIRRMRRVYSRRREQLLESLRHHLGAAVSVRGDAAGMHAFVRIEDPELCRRAERNRVQLRSAQSCYLQGDGTDEYLFGFSALPERTIREGVRRLGR